MAESPLARAHRYAETFLASVDARPVAPAVSRAALLESLHVGSVPVEPTDPTSVVDELVAAVEPAVVATTGSRYFGFVNGGTLPAARAADWLTSTWDQNGALAIMSPAVAAVEEVAGGWCLELLGLPADASFGFVSGCTMANASGLAAARHRLLAKAGWDVEANGLFGAPTIHVVIGGEAHSSIAQALRLVGFGASRVHVAAADEQGRMRADALAAVLQTLPPAEPVIICTQAGNVNTGAFDPFDAIADAARDRAGSTWIHVDGAFGLWAAASPRFRHLVRGVERADSWATDGHKWLNVPYDSGIVFCRDAAAHSGALSQTAAYLHASDAWREPMHFTPEASRRARGFAVWAAIRSLGSRGVAAMIERGCDRAHEMAARLGAVDGISVLNDVVINQVLVRFGDDDELTDETVAAVQADGTCWAGATTWHGRRAMRISVSSWSTTSDDIGRSAEAIVGAWQTVSGR